MRKTEIYIIYILIYTHYLQLYHIHESNDQKSKTFGFYV